MAIFNIQSCSSRPGVYRHEVHDIIIPRILHVKQLHADWENGDWIFRILLDYDKFIFHIRTDMHAYGDEWWHKVAAKSGDPRSPQADRDEELAKELSSYSLAMQKRNDLLAAITAYYTR